MQPQIGTYCNMVGIYVHRLKHWSSWVSSNIKTKFVSIRNIKTYSAGCLCATDQFFVKATGVHFRQWTGSCEVQHVIVMQASQAGLIF